MKIQLIEVNKAPKGKLEFPILARHLASQVTVLFFDETSGVEVDGTSVGFFSKEYAPITSPDWVILPAGNKVIFE